MNDIDNTNNLYLKNIYELLGETFHIPAYQRGYRWTAIQVKELLDDIWEFTQKKDSDSSAFYCLQPIVVVNGNGNWQVVDGQQRLTTLYIILHYLENVHLRRSFSDAFNRDLFKIEYETRPDSNEFLQNIPNALKVDNIDFYHMRNAYEAVVEWFKDKNYNDNNLLLALIMAKPKEARSVKVIWYDLSHECEGNDYAIDVFSRINIGKIPLTNAELIKALFLQNSRFLKNDVKLKQIHIASEWDSIEKRLQEPGFWHFIYRTDQNKDYTTRIEYIFDLMKGKKIDDESFFTFHKFSTEFKIGTTDIDNLWKEVKKYFLTFDEWYRDHVLYHQIGFLVDCGQNIATIKAQAEKPNSTKKEFKAYLKKEISNQVKCQLKLLEYPDPLIKKVLLLFNIQTLLSSKETYSRFPFDKYKKESWDIEHIRSQTANVPTNANRIAWLDEVKTYLTDNLSLQLSEIENEFLDEISKLLLEQKMDDQAFSHLYQNIQNYFGESEETDWEDGLGNLALLDTATNRSYKNSLFPIKRSRIIDNDKKGVFVPICTKNTFLKFYSNSYEEFKYWNQSDADDYLNAIGKALVEFLPVQGELNG